MGKKVGSETRSRGPRRVRPPTDIVGHWPAAILAVDPAATSGWSLWRDGTFIAAGLAKSARDRAELCRRLLEVGSETALGAVYVEEEWSPGGWRSFAAVVGVARASGRWHEALDVAGLPIVRRAAIPVASWRAKTLGRSDLKRDQAHDLAIRVAERYAGLALPTDAAEAVCLGLAARDSGRLAPAWPDATVEPFLSPLERARRAAAARELSRPRASRAAAARGAVARPRRPAVPAPEREDPPVR